MSEWDEYPRYVNQDGVEVAPVSYPRGYDLIALCLAAHHYLHHVS
jgi:hypothetical protein